MGKHFSLGPGAKRVTDASFVDEMLFRSGFRTTSTKKGKASKCGSYRCLGDGDMGYTVMLKSCFTSLLVTS